MQLPRGQIEEERRVNLHDQELNQPQNIVRSSVESISSRDRRSVQLEDMTQIGLGLTGTTGTTDQILHRWSLSGSLTARSVMAEYVRFPRYQLFEQRRIIRLRNNQIYDLKREVQKHRQQFLDLRIEYDRKIFKLQTQLDQQKQNFVSVLSILNQLKPNDHRIQKMSKELQQPVQKNIVQENQPIPQQQNPDFQEFIFNFSTKDMTQIYSQVMQDSKYRQKLQKQAKLKELNRAKDKIFEDLMKQIQKQGVMRQEYSDKPKKIPMKVVETDSSPQSMESNSSSYSMMDEFFHFTSNSKKPSRYLNEILPVVLQTNLQALSCEVPAYIQQQEDNQINDQSQSSNVLNQQLRVQPPLIQSESINSSENHDQQLVSIATIPSQQTQSIVLETENGNDFESVVWSEFNRLRISLAQTQNDQERNQIKEYLKDLLEASNINPDTQNLRETLIQTIINSKAGNSRPIVSNKITLQNLITQRCRKPDRVQLHDDKWKRCC